MLPHGVMFHHFHNDKHPDSQGSISLETFTCMLDYLNKNYDLLSSDEWLEMISNNKLKNKYVCITFDDNLRCQFDIAYPVLKKYNIKAFWFVYSSPLCNQIERLEVYRYFRSTQFSDIDEFYDVIFNVINQSEWSNTVKKALENFSPDEYLKDFPFYSKQDKVFRFVRDKVLGPDKYNKIMDEMIKNSNINLDSIQELLWMDRECIKKLHNDGHIVGMHSHTHPTSLKNLDRFGQAEEYQKNYNCLSEITGNKPFSMSHPCNSYNDITLEILKELEIKIGFRANMSQATYSQYEYPRKDHAMLLREINHEDNSIYK